MGWSGAQFMRKIGEDIEIIVSWGSICEHEEENWVGCKNALEDDRTSADKRRLYGFISRATSYPKALEQSSRCQHLVFLGREPPAFSTKTAQSELILRPLSGGPKACVWVLGLRIPGL